MSSEHFCRVRSADQHPHIQGRFILSNNHRLIWLMPNLNTGDFLPVSQEKNQYSWYIASCLLCALYLVGSWGWPGTAIMEETVKSKIWKEIYVTSCNFSSHIWISNILLFLYMYSVTAPSQIKVTTLFLWTNWAWSGPTVCVPVDLSIQPSGSSPGLVGYVFWLLSCRKSGPVIIPL